MCKRSPLCNSMLGVCFFVLIATIAAFFSLAYFFGLIDTARPLITPPPSPQVHLAPLTDYSFGGLSYPCTLNGCNVTGTLNSEQWHYYSVQLGNQGHGYVFQALGSDLRAFNVAAAVDVLPTKKEIALVPYEATSALLTNFEGSCIKKYIYFGITPYENNTGPYTLLIHGALSTTGTNQLNYCSTVNTWTLYCLMIAFGGIVGWLVSMVMWVGYSLASVKRWSLREDAKLANLY